MARNSINRSISFDPELFSAMEDRRGGLMMDRSEYIKRCILRDMMGDGSMNITTVPQSLVKSPNLRAKIPTRKKK